MYIILLFIVGGVFALGLGADMIVRSSINLANIYKISGYFIGFTVVALGTSLPELAATVISAVKHEHDIAIGNIIGSNIFNLLGVMAGPALLSPGPINKAVVTRDIPFMLALTLVLWLFAFLPPRRGQVGRLPGLVFLLGYVGYLYNLMV